MPIMRAETSTLLLIDFQAKLMPAIGPAAATLANARRLVDAAGLVGAPVLFTEQNPKGLGPTVAELAPDPSAVLPKMTFGAVGAPDFFEPPGARPRRGRRRMGGARLCTADGARAHRGRPARLCRQLRRGLAPSRKQGDRTSEDGSVRRRNRHLEMVVFEWLQTAGHPRFKEAIALIK